jgi:hypothetical protein
MPIKISGKPLGKRLGRPLLAAAFVLAAAFSLITSSNASAEPNAIGSLRFLGATTLSNDLQVDGTLVGGLSGLDYDPASGTWAIISDDKSDKAPARFYLGRIEVTAGAPKVTLDHAVVLQQADGKPYPNAKQGGEVPDPESIRFDPSGKALWWSTEPDRKLGVSPFVRETDLDGKFIANLLLPSMFKVTDPEHGPRHNLGFEGLSFTPKQDALWLGMESALIEDGPIATTKAGTLARFTKFDRDGEVVGQYAYPVDPIQAVPTGKNADNGVSEILSLDDNRLLVLERSGVEGADGVWTVYIRLYQADVGEATDISSIPALAGEKIAPMTKRLVLDLSKLPELGSAALPKIDNIEGVSFGPDLPNGHRSLVLVSDNNFNPEQVTQFLAFEVLP